jgi:hypothetical protein
MRIRVQVVIEGENGHDETVEEVGSLERGALRPEELGLTLCEAKQLLHAVQQSVVTEQVEQYLAQCAVCSHCGRHRSRKGTHEIVYRTLFGKLKLVSPRLYDCPCQESGRHSTSPLTELLAARTAPELSYLETKFASLMSYGLSVELLAELLPIGSEITRTTMRRELHPIPTPPFGVVTYILPAESTATPKGELSVVMIVGLVGLPFGVYVATSPALATYILPLASTATSPGWVSPLIVGVVCVPSGLYVVTVPVPGW